MERIIRLQIERLPEGVYLGTSNDVEGLVVQGDTIAEVIEYAREMTPLIEETLREYGWGRPPAGSPAPDKFEMPVVLAA